MKSRSETNSDIIVSLINEFQTNSENLLIKN